MKLIVTLNETIRLKNKMLRLCTVCRLDNEWAIVKKQYSNKFYKGKSLKDKVILNDIYKNMFSFHLNLSIICMLLYSLYRNIRLDHTL